MRAELGLSKTEARCVSAWTGYRATAVETVYTSPTWDYDIVVISVPAEMRGAAFSSAELGYAVSSVGGTKSIRFEDTREMYSDTALLKRLQNGGTEISLLFSYKASGGSGGEGTHESTCYWRNLALFAEYTPSGAVQGTVQLSGRSVFYSFDRASAAPGEETGMSLSVTPAPGRVAIELRPAGGGDICGAAEGAGGANVRLSFITGHIDAADRVSESMMRLTIDGEEGQWFHVPFRLVKERAAPVLSAVWEDELGAYDRAGVFVQGMSLLKLTFSAQPDTEADGENTIVMRRLVLGGREYVSGADVFSDIQTDIQSGDIPYTLYCTDAYGMTGELDGSVYICPYSEPEIRFFEAERCAFKYSSGGEGYFEREDGGERLLLSAAGNVSPVNGNNAWTLSCREGTLMSGTDGQSVELDEALSGEYSAAQEHIITLTLADLFSSVTKQVIVSKAGGIFSLEEYGVAVGKRATGSRLSPRFECAWEARFEAGAFDGDGNPMCSGVYSSEEKRIGSFMGKPLYRKGMVLNEWSASSQSLTIADFEISPGHITSVNGFVMTRDYGDLPINCYHSGSIRSFCRPDGHTGRVLGYCGCANSGAVIFIEYTKEGEA